MLRKKIPKVLINSFDKFLFYFFGILGDVKVKKSSLPFPQNILYMNNSYIILKQRRGPSVFVLSAETPDKPGGSHRKNHPQPLLLTQSFKVVGGWCLPQKPILH